MDRKLRIGIIGCGGIAEAHANRYMQRQREVGDIEVVALCDIIPGKAEEFAKGMGIPNVNLYENHVEMLDKENLDGVSVCTYNREHARCTIDALNRGVNVVCEKPMSVTLDEAVAMCKAEKESGKILSIGFQPRFAPDMQQMKEIVRSGELGKVYYIQTGGGRRRGIPGDTFIKDSTAGLGAVGDIGCYSLDMVLDALNYPKPLTVTAFMSDYIGTNPDQYEEAADFSVDDFAAAFIRLEGGIIIDFRIAWAMNVDTPGDTVILGKEGGLRIPSDDCWNGDFCGDMTMYKTVNGDNIEYPIDRLPDDQRQSCWIGKIGSFVDAIKTGGPSPIPTSQIIINQAIIDAIVRSAKLGKEVEVVIPEI